MKRNTHAFRWRFIQWGADGNGGHELYDQQKDAKNDYNLAETPEYKNIRKERVLTGSVLYLLIRWYFTQ